MKPNPSPLARSRKAEDIARELLARLPLYLTGWAPGETGRTQALVRIFARYLEAIGERIDRAADKNGLAFLDFLGVDLLPAQPARAPVVFAPLPQPIHGQIPASTGVGAQLSTSNDLVVFETENAIDLTSATLTDLVVISPELDVWADHGADLSAGHSFTLLDALTPVEHTLYVAHDPYCAVIAATTLEVKIEVQTPATWPFTVNVLWQYWDGSIWCPFNSFAADSSNPGASDSVDSTKGLTKSGIGTIYLKNDAHSVRCSPAPGGVESYWIQAKVYSAVDPSAGALAKVPGLILPKLTVKGLTPTGSYPSAQLQFHLDYSKDAIVTPRLSVRLEDWTFQKDQTTTVQVVAAGCGIVSASFLEPEVGWNYPNNTKCHVTVERFGFGKLEKDVLLPGQDPGKTHAVLTVWVESTPSSESAITLAFGRSAQVDLSNTIFPFGRQADAGAVFELAGPEELLLPNGKITLFAKNGYALNAVDEQYVGRNWEIGAAQSNEDILCVAFQSAKRGVMAYMSGASGEIQETDDGGDSWLEPAVRPMNTFPAYAVTYAGPDRIVAVGVQGMITTHDIGQSGWITRGAPANKPLTGNDLYSVAFLGAAPGFAVGMNCTILRKNDATKEIWELNYSSGSGSLYAVAFADPLHAVAVGDGIILCTSNGGNQWGSAVDAAHPPVVFAPGGTLRSVAFADRMRGVAVGDGGLIVITEDSGYSWKALSGEILPNPVNLLGVAFADSSNGVIVGEHGTILATHDGGETWSMRPAIVDVTLNSVAFADPQRVVAVGESGTILISTCDASPEPSQRSLAAEYWTGAGWQPLSPSSADIDCFVEQGGRLSFTVPADACARTMHDQRAMWFRVRILSGGFFTTRTFSGGVTMDLPNPPSLEGFWARFTFHSDEKPPQFVKACNDFVWEDHAADDSFSPFVFVADEFEELYLGFDGSLPSGFVSLYFDVEDSAWGGWEATWHGSLGTARPGVSSQRRMEPLAYRSPGSSPSIGHSVRRLLASERRSPGFALTQELATCLHPPG